MKIGLILMSTAVVNIKDANGFSRDICVLFDSASEENFITKAACSKSNLKAEAIQEAVTGINNLDAKLIMVVE